LFFKGPSNSFLEKGWDNQQLERKTRVKKKRIHVKKKGLGGKKTILDEE